MLNQPFHTFKGVVDFLAMDYSDHEIKKAVEYSNFNVLKEQEEKTGFKEKPIKASTFFRTGAYNQWPEHISQEFVNEFYSLNRYIMDRFGYHLLKFPC